MTLKSLKWTVNVKTLKQAFLKAGCKGLRTMINDDKVDIYLSSLRETTFGLWVVFGLCFLLFIYLYFIMSNLCLVSINARGLSSKWKFENVITLTKQSELYAFKRLDGMKQ